MDYTDVSNKFEQGLCKLQRLYTMMTVMGIALLVLSWFTDLVEEDILSLTPLMRIPMICTSVYGVLLIILAAIGTYGLKTRKPSYYKGVYFGSLVFMLMCFIGCILALTCYFTDYKNFKLVVEAFQFGSKIPQDGDELELKDVANDRRYSDECLFKAQQALHHICLLLSMCLFLYTFIMAGIYCSMRKTTLEMQECSEILLRAARSFDASNMLLSANPPRALTPHINRSNSTKGTGFNTLDTGMMIEKENELYGKVIKTSLSAKLNCENKDAYSVVKDNGIKKPKHENSFPNGKGGTDKILI